MTDQQIRKHAIRAFMRAHYTDERLAWLLAHARAGKLMYTSCCCFIGIATADHALRAEHRCVSRQNENKKRDHLNDAELLHGAAEADDAYLELWLDRRNKSVAVGAPDVIRRRILIPMIRAEMRRRAWVREVRPRWATQKQQCLNTRRNKRVELDGVSLTVAEWADLKGLKRESVVSRLKRGYTPEQALTTPIKQYKPRRKR